MSERRPKATVNEGPAPPRAPSEPTVPQESAVIEEARVGRRLTFSSRLAALAGHSLVIKLIPVALLVGIWHVASLSLPSFILPSPLLVVQTFVRRAASGVILEHLAVSLVRVAIGFVVAGAAGILVGFLTAYSRPARLLFDYLIRAIQPIPGIAWIGLTLVWFGLSETSIISVIVITVFPVVALTTYEGFRGVDPEFIKTARTLGVRSNLNMFRFVSFPSTLPHIMNGLHMGLAYGWRVLAAAEIVGASEGLGYWLNFNRIALRTEDVFVVLVIFSTVMILFEEVVYRRVEQKVLGGWIQ